MQIEEATINIQNFQSTSTSYFSEQMVVQAQHSLPSSSEQSEFQSLTEKDQELAADVPAGMGYVIPTFEEENTETKINIEQVTDELKAEKSDTEKLNDNTIKSQFQIQLRKLF